MHWKVPGPKKLQVALEWQGLVFSKHWLIGVHDESSSPIWNPSAHSPATQKSASMHSFLSSCFCMAKHSVFSAPQSLSSTLFTLLFSLFHGFHEFLFWMGYGAARHCTLLRSDRSVITKVLSYFVSKKHLEYLKKATTHSAEKCIRYTSQLFNGYWHRYSMQNEEQK